MWSSSGLGWEESRVWVRISGLSLQGSQVWSHFTFKQTRVRTVETWVKRSIIRRFHILFQESLIDLITDQFNKLFLSFLYCLSLFFVFKNLLWAVSLCMCVHVCLCMYPHTCCGSDFWCFCETRGCQILWNGNNWNDPCNMVIDSHADSVN